MKVWVDLTNAPHAVVLAPLVRAMEARGDTVEVTARDYGQTVDIAAPERPRSAHHRPPRRRRAGRQGAGGGRPRGGADRWARGRGFDAALAHGSTDQPMVARALRIPATTMFDYEYAVLQHSLNCRLARRTLVPEAIPPGRLARYGAPAGGSSATRG